MSRFLLAHISFSDARDDAVSGERTVKGDSRVEKEAAKEVAKEVARAVAAGATMALSLVREVQRAW